MNQLDMNQLLSMLSKMDKKDLEKGLNQAAQVLNSKEKDQILNQLNQSFKK